jgi:hypothetical protein
MEQEEPILTSDLILKEEPIWKISKILTDEPNLENP